MQFSFLLQSALVAHNIPQLRKNVFTNTSTRQTGNLSSLPWVHPLQSPLCLLGCRVVLLVLSLLVFQGVRGLHEDLQDPLSQEVPEVQVLLLVPRRIGYRS